MIPESILKRGAELSQGATIFGQPIESLTKEEAIALMAYAFDLQQRTIKEGRDLFLKKILKKVDEDFVLGTSSNKNPKGFLS